MLFLPLPPSTRNRGGSPWKAIEYSSNADLGRNDWVADDDRRELYLSVGCAMENLMVAAEYFGFQHRTVYAPRAIMRGPAGRHHVHVGRQARRGAGGSQPLDAILERHTTHGRFADGAVSDEDTQAFRRCLTDPDLDLCFVSDPYSC